MAGYESIVCNLFRKYVKPLKVMINTKIPYVVYPIVLGLMCGWLFSTVAAGKSATPKPLPAPKVKSETVRINPQSLAGNIVNKNAFDLALSPVPILTAEGGGISTQPETPFNGKLIGLIQNTKNNTGIAIVNVEGQTLSIKTGIEKNGLKLVSIDNITAVIERNNRKYSILLEGGDMKAPNSQTPQATAQQTQSSGSNLNIAIKKAELKSEIQDMNKVLGSARVAPLYDNGAFQGYQVVGIRDDSPLKKLGLLQGDIITRINGSELTNPASLMAMFNQIDDISAISIDMIRNNDKKTLFVELQ